MGEYVLSCCSTADVNNEWYKNRDINKIYFHLSVGGDEYDDNIGVTITQEDSNLKQAVVHAGFAEILGDKVTLLAEIAEWPDEIDLDRARRAEDRARARLEKREANLDVARAEMALKRSLARQDILAGKR